MNRDLGTRSESEGATGEHGGGVGADGRVGRTMKVPDHGVRVPTTEELDGIVVDTGIEKGGGSAGAERTGIDLIGLDVEGVGPHDDDASS